VVAESASTRVGLLIVDSVSEVLLLPLDSVEPTPEVAAGDDAEYLRASPSWAIGWCSCSSWTVLVRAR